MLSDQARFTDHDPGAPPGCQGAGVDLATVAAADEGLRSLDQGGFDQLYALIQRQMKIQEKEAFKQEQRWRSVQVQLTQLQDEREAERLQADRRGMEQDNLEEMEDMSEHSAERGSPNPNTNMHVPIQPRAWSGATIPKFEDGDDIEQYLTTFERLATAYRWPREEWAVYLVPHLSGKARSAYVAMDMNEAMDYDSVKEAILAKYEINEEMYRQRFREPDIRPGETPRELYNRLRDLYKKWVKPAQKTVEEVGEILILEQYLRTLSPEVRVWVKEHNPKTGQRAAELVEAFIAARRGPKVFRYDKSHRQPTTKGKSVGFGGSGPVGREGGRGVEERTFTARSTERPVGRRDRDPPVCHFCGKEGHIRPHCPAIKVKGANTMCCVPRPKTYKCNQEIQGKMQTATVSVNGIPATALLDSASTQTLVMPYLVQSQQLGGGVVDVWCVHGDKQPYPTAQIYLEVEGQTYFLEVGVVPDLSHPVLLGQDVPMLSKLLRDNKPVNMVVTRSRAEQGRDQPPTDSSHSHFLEQLPFSYSEFPIEDNGKVRKSRRQRRMEKLLGSSREGQPQLPQPSQSAEDSWWEVPSGFEQLQKEDPTLKVAFSKAVEVDGVQTGTATSLTGEGYFLRGGLLYHRPEGGALEQLVVPHSLRERVLTLGHNIPWAGHLGGVKTLERIANKFYWPGLYTNVQKFCAACPDCQLASHKKVRQFPLQPMPIIDIPFSRIAMDIVGPLERTHSGFRYILVVCDYATRYPEAFPLRRVTAQSVAQALLQLFSRVGIPREIVTDQGTVFLSQTLRQVYGLLGVKGIRTTPYHPQTDGLVERYNQTLKSMLRKFVAEDGKDWDRWLPYLMFAYREVPQASTGYSPFELLYGRQVRGPLDVLRDAWEQPSDPQPVPVLQYVLQMREKMDKMAKLVHDNMEKAQVRQKDCFDKKTKARVFQPGQEVLLLLPTSDNKLLARWQGPFKVLRKMGPATYEISMPEHRKKKQTFHVNLLKEWHSKADHASQQLLVRAVKKEEDQTDQFLPPNTGDFQIHLDLSHLSSEMQKQLLAIIPPGLFQDKPGFTSVVEHNITLKDPSPARQRMYRVPERLLPALKEELEVMKSLGVIERSQSEWSSPIVLVLKKDGSIRFCIDFRKLNSQSNFDAYPTPRLDDLIECIGKAQYISTLDLCRGYWQVPLAPEARPYTAFRTPQGLFQFTVMPFGLQGAPATFQRLMDQVLAGAEAFSAAYLDDIVIYSLTWEDHVQHLKEVLQRLHQAGLTVQPKKCSIAQQKAKYLGYLLGHGEIRPQQDKVQAVKNCPRPRTKTQLKSFLGLAGWYRRFVPHFATRAAPLTDLTRKSSPNQLPWEERHEKAFLDLKEVLCNDPVLQSPDFSQTFTVQTDASGVGLGAVLLQGEGDDQKPVAYVSRKLWPRETRYSAIELECLAIKWALETFKYYLLGRDFILQTDHRGLQWLHKMKDSNNRISRWVLEMQPYRFQIQYRPGKANVVADFLSRHPDGELSGEGEM